MKKFFTAIATAFLKAYYFLYYKTPKGKKEVMFQAALTTIENKTKAKEHLQRNRIKKCNRRGHHSYITVADPKKLKDVLTHRKICKDCGHEIKLEKAFNAPLKKQLEGTGVELKVVE